jgi:hypothetical protein
VALSIVAGLGGAASAQTEPAAAAAPPAAPEVAAAAGPAPPPAPAPTRANIVSTGARQWDVMVDGEHVCSTPCTGPMFPQQFMVLQSHERRPVLVEVGNLPPGDVIVSAKPYESGRYAGGVVATTLGGMALAVGITFLAVGLAKDRDGFTIAGAISGGAGLLTLPYGIYLMTTAVPSFSVTPAAPGYPGAAAGIAGTF